MHGMYYFNDNHVFLSSFMLYRFILIRNNFASYLFIFSFIFMELVGLRNKEKRKEKVTLGKSNSISLCKPLFLSIIPSLPLFFHPSILPSFHPSINLFNYVSIAIYQATFLLHGCYLFSMFNFSVATVHLV